MTLPRVLTIAGRFVVLAWMLHAPTGWAQESAETDAVPLYQTFRRYYLSAPGSAIEEASKKALFEQMDALDPESQDSTWVGMQETFLREAFGSEAGLEKAIGHYRRYLDAEPQSPEEVRAYDALVGSLTSDFADAPGVVVSMLDDYLGIDPGEEPDTADTPGAPSDLGVGPESPNEPMELDIELRLSRKVITAGEPWMILGEIHNRSHRRVWIADSYCTLTLAPELFGEPSQESAQMLLPAVFPTTPIEDIEQVSIGPNETYEIFWIPDNLSRQVQRDQKRREAEAASSRKEASYAGAQAASPERRSLIWLQVLRIRSLIANYLFFQPGEYSISTVVHAWSEPPVRHVSKTTQQAYLDLSKSSTFTAETRIAAQASPIVLILGATIGGLLAFFIREFQIVGKSDEKLFDWQFLRARLLGFLASLASALFLTGTVIILLSRLSNTDFLINVEISDFWGAIAAGFIIQWTGPELLSRLIPSRRKKEEPAA